MDIVLNTNFDNPRLPVVPVPGFWDDFNRPEADTLGVTVDGKAWEVYDFPSTSSVWGTTGSGTATMKSAATAYHSAVVDALTADGTLTATLSSVATDDDRRAGLTVRLVDDTNFVAVVLGAQNGSPRVNIEKRVGGTLTVVQQVTDVTVTAGDVLEVALDGHSISVAVNGVEVNSALVPEFTAATRHGMYCFSTATATWDDLRFEAASS